MHQHPFVALYPTQGTVLYSTRAKNTNSVLGGLPRHNYMLVERGASPFVFNSAGVCLCEVIWRASQGCSLVCCVEAPGLYWLMRVHCVLAQRLYVLWWVRYIEVGKIVSRHIEHISLHL